MTKILQVGLALAALGFAGCWTTQNVRQADTAELAREGRVVFTRGESYTIWFGSRSPWKQFEVTYERISRNEAGQCVVEVGIRYTGGTSWTDWWDDAPRSVTMGAQCHFYRNNARQLAGPAVYSTNRRTLTFRRGETFAYRAVAPVADAQDFQLVIGE